MDSASPDPRARTQPRPRKTVSASPDLWLGLDLDLGRRTPPRPTPGVGLSLDLGRRTRPRPRRSLRLARPRARTDHVTGRAIITLPLASSGAMQQQYYSARCRNHRPPKGGVSRESSRISWRMPRSDGPKALPPEGRGTPWSIAPRLPDSCGKPRSTPGARTTRRLRPRVASATSTATATVKPTLTRGCAEATTPGVGDATTAGRIGAPRPNHPACRLSAGPYDGRRSRPGSEPRLPSRSTQGRRGRNCGSRTTD
jgi:hypothetical protein